MGKPIDINSQLTHERLKKVLYYDPWTGWFTWIANVNRRFPIGSRASQYVGNGYLRVAVFGKRYMAHRLAWFYVHGVWPAEELDHVNRDQADNRIANLRQATRSQNAAYARCRKDSISGFKGVGFNKRDMNYFAYYSLNKIYHRVGTFASAEKAAAAREIAIAAVRGKFTYREVS